jgi:5-formyltetrahydrofolate cyclo-ligase
MKKKELRKLFKSKRKEMADADRERLSKAIFELASQQLELDGKNISVFLPIIRFHEINTYHFINQVKASFYLPVIDSITTLKHVKYESSEQIKTTKWGIPEPQYGETIAVQELDLVLVPLLAIDQKGYRVGYGKGFYDRFLSECRSDCQFIGLSYFDPISIIEDIHEADVKLHGCITPTNFYRF